MSEMRVRIEVEIWDEMGDSVTLTGASQRIDASGNPLWFARKFDELAERIQADIRQQLVAKHGDLRSLNADPPASAMVQVIGPRCVYCGHGVANPGDECRHVRGLDGSEATARRSSLCPLTVK